MAGEVIRLVVSFEKALDTFFKGGGTRAEVAIDLRLSLESIVGKKSDQYWELFADQAIVRSRELGRISGYEQVRTKTVRFKAVLDGRTTVICRKMHGRIIEVSTCTLDVGTFSNTHVVDWDGDGYNDLIIGKQSTNFFTGSLDEVKFYNEALSASKVLNIFNKIQINDGLVCYMSMDNPRLGDRSSARVTVT